MGKFSNSKFLIRSCLHRLFFQQISGENATKQNIPSGTVIDTHIVSPVITEFYMNSHLAFQVHFTGIP